MPLVLDGTNGVSGVDGTASNPAIEGTDSNTGIFYPAADTVAIGTGGTEALRVNSAQNVGIGTQSPTAKLQATGSTDGGDVIRADANSSNGLIILRPDGANGNQFRYGGNGANANILRFVQGGDTERMRLDASGRLLVGTTTAAGLITAVGTSQLSHQYSGSPSRLDFGQYNTTGDASINNTANAALLFATNNTERARITSTGELLVGAAGMGNIYGARLSVEGTSGGSTASEFRVLGSAVSTAATYFIKADNNTTTSNVFCKFVINSGGAASGQINANGASAAAFGSWSDERLKENIVDLPPQLSNICALRPVEFDYIESEGGGHQIGFVAQQMEAIYPDVIGEREDGMKSITGWSKTEARLVKAIQELNAKVEAQAAEIAALKGNA